MGERDRKADLTYSATIAVPILIQVWPKIHRAREVHWLGDSVLPLFVGDSGARSRIVAKAMDKTGVCELAEYR